MALRSVFRVVLVFLATCALQCNAWTPRQQARTSLIASSAVVPIVQWSTSANAMVDQGSGYVDASTINFANADALQIPVLAAYCAMALWVVPQTVKSIKTTWPDDKR